MEDHLTKSLLSWGALACLLVIWATTFTIGSVLPSEAFRAEIREPYEDYVEKIRAYRNERENRADNKATLSDDTAKDATWPNRKRPTLKDQEPIGAWNTAANLAIILISWTWSNLLILCVVASIVGILGKSFRDGKSLSRIIERGFVRGMFIYLIILAGNLVFMGSFPDVADPVEADRFQYFRLAGFASLASFMAGFSPSFFIKVTALLERQFLGPLEQQDGAEPKEKEGLRDPIVSGDVDD